MCRAEREDIVELTFLDVIAEPVKKWTPARKALAFGCAVGAFQALVATVSTMPRDGTAGMFLCVFVPLALVGSLLVGLPSMIVTWGWCRMVKNFRARGGHNA